MEVIYEVLKIKQEVRKLPKKFEKVIEFNQIRSPQDVTKVIKFISTFIGETDREHFIVLCLNTKNQIVAVHVAHIGSLNASLVSPREVFKAAILNNAASIICAHNHPSYSLQISPEDIEVTKRLIECGYLIGIELIDHVIVNNETGVSLKEKGYF